MNGTPKPAASAFGRLLDYPDTRYYPEQRLLTWHPQGVLDADKAQYMARWLGTVEPELGLFDRFADLSHISGINLTVSDVCAIAEIRAEDYKGTRVTTVFFVSSPLSYAVAAMYQQLMAETPIRIEVVVLLSAACHLLGVGPELLIYSPQRSSSRADPPA